MLEEVESCKCHGRVKPGMVKGIGDEMIQLGVGVVEGGTGGGTSGQANSVKEGQGMRRGRGGCEVQERMVEGEGGRVEVKGGRDKVKGGREMGRIGEGQGQGTKRIGRTVEGQGGEVQGRDEVRVM